MTIHRLLASWRVEHKFLVQPRIGNNLPKHFRVITNPPVARNLVTDNYDFDLGPWMILQISHNIMLGHSCAYAALFPSHINRNKRNKNGDSFMQFFPLWPTWGGVSAAWGWPWVSEGLCPFFSNHNTCRCRITETFLSSTWTYLFVI